MAGSNVVSGDGGVSTGVGFERQRAGDLAGLLQIRLHTAATQRTLEAALAGGRQAEQRTDVKQRSLLVRFGRRGIEQLVADHLDRGLTYTEIAKKYDVALSTVGKYIQQAKRQRAEELT